MRKVRFSIDIHAPKKKVWDVMLGDATYREWTKPFHSGSYYKGDWSEGSKILFLGPGSEGGGEEGMVSRIAENRPHEFISIEHLGTVRNGVEDTQSEQAKKWAHLHENYTFTETERGTRVDVDMDVIEQYESMFGDMWPKALQALKTVAER